MKNLNILFLFLISNAAVAQFKIKAGVVKSDVALKDITVSNLYTSKVDPLFGGLYYEFTPLDLIGIETGLQYTGIVEDAAGTNIDIENHYLSLPLSISYKPKSLISPGIGVMVSSLINSSVADIIDQKKLDASGFAKITINPIKLLGIELGYNHGLVPFLKWSNTNAGGLSINNGSVQNRFYYLALALKI
jgi:hypothetical protein